MSKAPEEIIASAWWNGSSYFQRHYAYDGSENEYGDTKYVSFEAYEKLRADSLETVKIQAARIADLEKELERLGNEKAGNNKNNLSNIKYWRERCLELEAKVREMAMQAIADDLSADVRAARDITFLKS